jgi:hypothetical protein
MSFDAPLPDVSLQTRPLPAWLQHRFLRPEEHVTFVRGPRWQPACERYLTHPLLFVLALALGAAVVGVGYPIAGSSPNVLVPFYLTAAGLVLGAIFVLGFASAYFTRLVATNFRLMILQGRELCYTWELDDLPESLLRYDRRTGKQTSRSIDLSALQTLLGSTSEQFVESKTILALGKHLGHIKAQRKDRP